MTTDVLHVEDFVVARGGRNVVRGVSLEIPSGEITALLGPNGAGKSSMVLAIGGVLKPVAGKVLLDEHDFAGKRPERIRSAGLAIVPEGRRLLPELTVAENLRVATYAHDGRGRARPGRRERSSCSPSSKSGSTIRPARCREVSSRWSCSRRHSSRIRGS